MTNKPKAQREVQFLLDRFNNVANNPQKAASVLQIPSDCFAPCLSMRRESQAQEVMLGQTNKQTSPGQAIYQIIEPNSLPWREPDSCGWLAGWLGTGRLKTEAVTLCEEKYKRFRDICHTAHHLISLLFALSFITFASRAVCSFVLIFAFDFISIFTSTAMFRFIFVILPLVTLALAVPLPDGGSAYTGTGGQASGGNVYKSSRFGSVAFYPSSS